MRGGDSTGISEPIYDGSLPTFSTVGVLSSTFGMTPLPSRRLSSSPDWCTKQDVKETPDCRPVTAKNLLLIRMSHPPTKSPLT